MKKLGLGIQELSKLRKNNYVYVDKTEIIHRLITTGSYYFLSRPRRFGKSLLVNTIEEIFRGNKDLFKDTWIYDKWNFEERFPVIKISFSNLAYHSLPLEDVISKELDLIAEVNSITFDKSEIYSEKFRELIQKLGEKNPVAILIDEYDKPIIDYITDIETAEINREVLKKFYSVVKDLDKHIKLLFITGVSKFSRVSFFSELNNLTDITIKKQYADITGYSEKEIEDNYGEYLREIEDEFNLDRKGLMELIKLWYNGYSWDGKTFVYNPYSVISFLNDREFKNFWFKSGTATFLVKQIREKDLNIKDYDTFINVPETALDSYEINNIDITVLLFQAGYLTIKEKIINPHNFSLSYNLGYPNLEIRQSLYLLLGAEFSDIQSGLYSQKAQSLLNSLDSNNMEIFIDTLRSIFASIPNNLVSGKYESYYHTVIYLALMFIGTNIKVEQKTNNGIIDAVVETKDFVYIMEFKMSSASSAIKQIKEKKYYEPYLSDKREVFCMGIAFDKKDRNVDDFIIVGLDELRLHCQ
ncbi:MAG: AAA family ATPase [Candidatus Cloacimonadota bacterium]|nr:MAG: AAA family ATPase [Candidatus Cloacimonadota bacterium]PIE78218.1 MAG: AAA family ATPase [Candidatus Delongbacteria bacterium]